MVYKTNFKNSGGFKNRFIIETKVLVTIYFNSYHKMLHTIVCGMDKDYVDRIHCVFGSKRTWKMGWKWGTRNYFPDICKIRSKPGLRLLLLLNQSVKHTTDGAALMFTFKSIGKTQH